MKKAVILFSGGLDSTTCLALAKSQHYDCYALSFSYGQKHSVELESARQLAQYFAVNHKIIELPHLGGSALTDQETAIPDYQGTHEIPVTYVPARNTIFLAFALSWAEVIGAHDIFIGVSAIDYSGYPDCRPEYIESFEKTANLATKIRVTGGHIKIHTPLISLSKAETIQLGLQLGVNYAMTVSCYQANVKGQACGVCDSCVLRKKGFVEANVDDPTFYYSKP